MTNDSQGKKMKGTFFNNGLEWKIETVGEAWSQGDPLKGTLAVTNHGNSAVSLQTAGVALAYAEIKKVHSRDESALKFESTTLFAGKEVSPKETVTLEFDFKLSENSPITDKKSSYFLCYGKDQKESHLQLHVKPQAMFLKITELLDNFHRFKTKEVKTTKNGIEFKIDSPDSREFANVEKLLLTTRFDGENLVMDFEFEVKKLDHSSITTKLGKEKVKNSQTLTPKQYSFGRGMINQDGILKTFQTVLDQVKLKPY